MTTHVSRPRLVSTPQPTPRVPPRPKTSPGQKVSLLLGGSSTVIVVDWMDREMHEGRALINSNEETYQELLRALAQVVPATCYMEEFLSPRFILSFMDKNGKVSSVVEVLPHYVIFDGKPFVPTGQDAWLALSERTGVPLSD